MVAPSLLSAAAQHGHGSRTQTLPRSSSVAGVLRARPGPASLSSSSDAARDPRGGLCRRERGEFGEDVGKVRFWIDAVQLCRFDQRSNTRPVDRALIVAGKKAVFAIECNRSHRALDAVGIHLDTT